MDHQLSNVVCSVRSLRNATLPVMRLPSEVLGMIFEALQASIIQHDPAALTYLHENEQFCVPNVHPCDWMYIREVCRRWHDVVDAHPALWTTVLASSGDAADSKPELIELFLRNSRQSPLNVQVNLLAAPHPVFVELFTHLPRVRRMQLLLPNPPETHLLPLLSQSGAPELQALTLTMLSTPSNDPHDITMFERLPTLFNDEMPALRSLEIRDFVTSALSTFRNLTQLQLSSITLCHHWSGAAHLLMNSLPTLEDLALYQVVDEVQLAAPPAGDDPAQRPRMQLPRLKKLSFDEVDERSVAEILKMMSFPANANLFLYYNFTQVVNSVATLKDIFTEGGKLGDASLAHLLADVTQVQLYAGRNFKGLYASGSTFAFHFRQTFLDPLRRTTFTPFPLLDTVMLKARELWLNAPTREVHDQERIRYMMIHAHSAVKLYCTAGVGLWVETMAVLPAPPPPLTFALWCPFLREVHMLDPRDVVFSATFLPALRAWLTRREQLKLPLQALYIYRIEGLHPLGCLRGMHRDVRLSLQEPTAQDWDEWQSKVVAALAPLTVKVEFISLPYEKRPRMAAPAHCKVQSGGGMWKWRTWDADHDPIDHGLDLGSVDTQLTDILCTVRNLRNAALPIMRLPPEVLGMIFGIMQSEIVQDREQEHNMNMHGIRRLGHFPLPLLHPHDWMGLRRVCRHWHAVVDGHAALWTTILILPPSTSTTDKPALIRLFLARSRRNSLTMHLNLMRNTAESLPLFTEVFAHVSRVRDMLLVMPNPPTEDMRLLLAQSRAPALQALTLSLLTTPGELDGGSATAPTLFRDELPSLRSLDIRMFFSTALSNFRDLTQLKLSAVMFRHHWAGLERLLRNSLHTLADFAMHHVVEETEPLPSTDDPMQLVHQPMQLPKLKKIAFEDTLDSKLAEVIRLFTIPANAELFLFFSYIQILDDENALAELFRGVASLRQLLADVTRVQIRACETSKDVYASGSTFAFQYRQAVLRDFNGQFFRPYPRLDVILRRAQELWLDAPADEVNAEERQRIVGDACHAVKLYCTLGAESWVDALRIPPHPETPEEDIEVSCPLLRELHLVDPRDVVLSATFLPMLLEYLVSRQRRNRQLQALYIYRVVGLMPLSEYFLPDEGEENHLKEPTLQDWEAWQDKVVSTLEQLNVKVEFRTVDAADRPRMFAPAHCKVQSGGGKWNWQTWDAEF
ncbi:hypothetical protein EIP86_003771 [Pleurotus ostreatoroseus]|nr:hypothetical protein EIP86_003771 [Pleurotus ostreatoroseus]